MLERTFLKDAITANATLSATLTVAGVVVIFGTDLQQFFLQGAALAALPTILGLFCTTKAIKYLKPSQALELTEPLFAAILAVPVTQIVEAICSQLL